MIQTKRVYDLRAHGDCPRFLVDRLWPRGVKKKDLTLAGWIKAVSPSAKLRHWFGHEPARWNEFHHRYFAELDGNPQAWQPLLEAARHGDITLVFGARDTEHNNAVALKDYLEARLQSRGSRRQRSQARG